MKRRIPIKIIFGILLIIFSQNLHGKPSGFAYTKSWLKALHYEQNNDGYKSRIDDPRFFSHPNGQINPQLELETFLKKLNSNTNWHCHFPYRYQVLLDNKLTKKSQIKCEKLEFFINELGTDGLSLVFVSQYADNPSSILGHIFLQIENTQRKVDGEPLVYLNHTLNYAAGIPKDTNSIEYIYKGILGGFKGQYSLYHFAEMMEKYNAVESRDIYTYPIKLTKPQTTSAIKHIWELLNFASQDYFFFDENCAYQILVILDVILPKYEFLKELKFYVTPIQVIKILNRKNMLKNHHFYPSLFHQLNWKLNNLSRSERYSYERLMSLKLKNLNQISSKKALEASLLAINFKKNENNGKLRQEFQNLKEQILIRRASLGLDQTLDKPFIKKVSPHLSHPDSRISLGAGSLDSNRKTTLTFRPAIHELLSPQQGYQKNSEISLLNIEMDYFHNTKKINLRKTKLFSLAKLYGNSTQSRTSWYLQLGSIAKKNECTYCQSLLADIRVGFTKSVFSEQISLFFLPQLYYNGRLAYEEFWQGGIGVNFGMSLHPINQLRFITFYSILIDQSKTNLNIIEMQSQWDFSLDWNLRFQTRQERTNKYNTLKSYDLGLGFQF